MKRKLAGVLAGSLTLCSCAATPRDAGFGDVQSVTLERTGKQVHWRQGAADGAAVDQALRQILSRELSADDVVQLALLRNRNLQATFEELGLAQADVLRAGLLRNPVFDAEIRFHSIGSGARMELSIVQNFIDSLLLPLRRQLAETAFEATKLRVSGAVLDLAAEVRTAFYMLQAAEEKLAMRKRVVLATEASSDLARRLHRAGNTRHLDLSNELALHEQAKLDAAATEAEVLRDQERLNALMGLWGKDTRWKIGHRLPQFPKEEMALDGLERQAIERSLDLGAARREIELSAQRLGLSGPVSVFSEATLGITGERDSDGTWGTGPAFSLPVPIFNLGQATSLQAQALLRQSEERFAALAVEIRSRVRAARNDMLAARNRAEHYRKVVLPLRERIVQETQEQYNAMQVSAFQLLLAKQQQIDSGSRYIETVRDYWVRRAELEAILSGVLPPAEWHAPARMEAGAEDTTDKQRGENG